jgi:mRNA interferase MazF
MEGFVKGKVISISFPFTNLSALKRRPALIVCESGYDDIIILPITSKLPTNKFYIELRANHEDYGYLPKDSFVRCDKPFTISSDLIINSIGKLDGPIYNSALEKLIGFLKNNITEA